MKILTREDDHDTAHMRQGWTPQRQLPLISSEEFDDEPRVSNLITHKI
jgi:hypothetical protein